MVTKYAVRINSFLRTEKNLCAALDKIAQLRENGINYVDLNYPEHFKDHSLEEIRRMLFERGLRLNAVATRFRDKYIHGDFTNKDSAIRRDAIELTKQAADACRFLEGNHIIVWLKDDGYDYSFQIDYAKAWGDLVFAFREVCAYTDLPISIEYKPYEERVHTLLDSYSATWNLIRDVGAENLGVTLDFCHALMKKESPGFVTAMLLEKNKLFSVHLNDGEGSGDDGLMVGAANFFQTLEVFYYLRKYQFDGIIYFDTFPKREADIDETRANLSMCRKMEELLDRIGMEQIAAAIENNNAAHTLETLIREL
ncbi:sugar phosphate isomerase/epimerase family protein [Dysosmobacter sp. Phy]